MATTNGNTARIRMPDGSTKTVSTVRGGAYDRYTSQGGVVISGSSRTNSTSTSTPSGPSYSYVDTSGKMQSVFASNPTEALKNATNIASNSGVMLNQSVQNTPTTPTTPQITSSSTPVVTNNTREGMKTGANSLVGAFGNDPLANWYGQYTEQQKKDVASYADSLRDLIGRKTDLALARSNQQYGSLMKNLDKEFQNSLSVAKTQAAAINPYGSQSTSEMQYADTLSKNYTDAAKDLTDQARMAQEALELGEMEAYMSIQKNMQDSYAQLTEGLYSALSDIQTQKTQQEQFAVTTNLAQYDNYLATLKSVQTPNPNELKNMTPEQLFQTTFFQQGLKAGLSPNEIMKDLVNQSDYNSKLMSIDQARVAQGWQGLALEAERNQLSRDTNKTLAQQNIIAGIAAVQPPPVNATPEERANYAKSIMGLSAGGKTDFRISTAAAKYESASRELYNLKGSIDSLAGSDPIFNIAAGYLPYSEKVKRLEAEVSRLVPLIGKGVLGDVGNLAVQERESIAKSIAGAKNTTDVRAALYNGMVDLVANQASVELSSYARQGYDTSAYVPVIDQINYYRDSSQLTTTPTSSSAPTGTFQFNYQAPSFDWSKFK
jgi:hypothetical protein